MKKIFIFFLMALILFVTSVKSYSKTEKTKVTKRNLGYFLILAGTYLAYDGYSLKETKIDISNPQLDTSNWSWSKEQVAVGYPWYVDSHGKIKNTGNVALKNVKIYETYFDSNGQAIAYGYTYPDVYWLDPLPVGTEDSWDDFDGSWNTEPANVTIRVEYNYDSIYRVEKKIKNENMGKMGIGIALVEIYLLVDYHLDLKKVQEKTGIDFKFNFAQNQINFIATTRLF